MPSSTNRLPPEVISWRCPDPSTTGTSFSATSTAERRPSSGRKKPAVHSRHGEPDIRPLVFQQRLEFREPQGCFADLPGGPAEDDLVKTRLDSEQHAGRNAPFELGLEHRGHMRVTAANGDVDGAFAVRILQRPSSPRRNQRLDDLDRCTAVGCLMKGGVTRSAVGPEEFTSAASS